MSPIKRKELPVVRYEGRSGSTAPTTAVLNHLEKHPSISASQGERLTELARRRLCELLGSVTEKISAFIANVAAKDMEQISPADNTT